MEKFKFLERNLAVFVFVDFVEKFCVKVSYVDLVGLEIFTELLFGDVLGVVGEFLRPDFFGPL